MKAGRGSSALNGWEDEDYEKMQEKLQSLADKLSGKNRIEQKKTEAEKKQTIEEVAKAVLEQSEENEDASSVDSRKKRARPSSSKRIST